jgi:hypothetical protein
VAAAVIAAVGISGLVRDAFMRTVGRRRDLTRRLGRLGCGAQLEFFNSVLGEPPTMRGPLDLGSSVAEPPAPGQLDQCFWVFPQCYVQVFVDDHSTVRGYAVTTRSRRFAPRFSFPPRVTRRHGVLRRKRGWDHLGFYVRLGRTRLADVAPPEHAPTVVAWAAARSWNYAELHYLGNPGYYLTFVAAASYAGPPLPVGDLHAALAEMGEAEAWPVRWPWEDPAGMPQWSMMKAVASVRQNTVANTYAVVDSQLLAETIPHYGPHGDEVRMLLS